MCFSRSSPDKVRVRWFFVPEGTPVIPFPTVFGSKNWEAYKGFQTDLGEQEKVTPWVDGSEPPWVGGNENFIDIARQAPEFIHIRIDQVTSDFNPPIARPGDTIPLRKIGPLGPWRSAVYPVNGGLYETVQADLVCAGTNPWPLQFWSSNFGFAPVIAQDLRRVPKGDSAEWMEGAPLANPDDPICSGAGVCSRCGPMEFAPLDWNLSFDFWNPEKVENWKGAILWGNAPPWRPMQGGGEGFFIAGFFPEGFMPEGFF